MPQESPKKSPVLHFLLTFAVVYLLTSMGLRVLFPQRFKEESQTTTPIILRPERRSFTIGRNVSVLVRNTTQETLTFPNRCPSPPLDIARSSGDQWTQLYPSAPAIPCHPLLSIAPASATNIDLSPWKYEAFSEAGTYRIALPPEVQQHKNGEEIIATDIRIKEPNMLVQLFRALITKPLLNALVLIAFVLPAHSLGWSIILLTLLVKLLLFLPSQHALEGQKRLQAIQPKIEDIKRKHQGDQKRITEETMKLWRTEKINPFQSCLPTVLQIPILLGLFFIIRDSGTLVLARHLLYTPFLSLHWTFGTMFLGILELTHAPYEGLSWSPSMESLTILLQGAPVPLIIGGLQFLQMKLAFTQTAAKKDQKKSLEDKLNPQMMMLYMLPLMIVFISGTLPAAVSLYWGASTIFSVGQQVVVNRQRS